jgi:hypothetical protein
MLLLFYHPELLSFLLAIHAAMELTLEEAQMASQVHCKF